MRLLTAGLVLAALAAGGCKKQKSATASAAPTGQSTDTAAPSSGANTNYQAGAGAAQNIRNAARRTVAINDMHQLGIAIEQMYSLNGRMPNVNDIKAEIRTMGTIAAAVNDGSIVLTGTSNHSGLWAYEAEADTKGGVGLVAGTARRMTADEIKAAPR